MTDNERTEETEQLSQISHATGFNATVNEQCVKLTEEYRAGTLTKTAAILRLQTLIPRIEGDDAIFEKGFAHYISILDNLDKYRDTIRARGQPAGTGDAEGTQQNGEGVQNTTGTSGQKRALTPDDDDSEEPAQRKLDTKLIPWSVFDDVSEGQLPPDLAQTRRLIFNFGSDIKLAKRLLSCAIDRPQFPDSEWSNVLIGRAVDLDSSNHFIAYRVRLSIGD